MHISYQSVSPENTEAPSFHEATRLPDEMIGTGLEVPSRTIFISEKDVSDVHDLVTNGQQRLRIVSETHETFFRFFAPCDSHVAYVSMKVSPVTWEKSRYPSYEVSASYTPCCNAAQSDPVDQKIKTLIQMVYDTYIRVIQRRFDDHCRQRNPPLALDLPCEQKRQAFLELPERERSGETYIRHRKNRPTDSAEVEEGQTPISASPVLLQPQVPCLVPHPAKRQQDDKAVDNPPIKRPRHQKRQTSEIASSLIKKIKSGMGKMKGKREEPFGHSDIQAIMSGCRQSNDDNDIDTLLEKLAEAFAATENEYKNEYKNKRWTSWYYSSCLRYILYRRRRCKRDQRASGAYIINSIVNTLLSSEGIKALAVILACAEQGYMLSEASITSEKDQADICKMVVKGLEGKLLAPPEHHTVPNVAIWVSIITKCSYRSACRDLGIPNLSVLRPEPVWTKEILVPYEGLVHRWHAFALEQPRLYQICQEHDPDKWVRLSVSEKFSLAVDKYHEEEPSSVVPLPNPKTQKRKRDMQATQLSSSPRSRIHNDALTAQQTLGEVNLVNVLLEAAYQTDFTGVRIQDVQYGQPCLDDNILSDDWNDLVNFNTTGLQNVMASANSIGSLEGG
ncbi:hypothetical protein F5Y06DRAFT_305408 [Hypoxylon sp. FL0890]|nr:hypothetical protein F5Y06DRAFT_305408 [Hypoxylon sp. FL0890]